MKGAILSSVALLSSGVLAFPRGAFEAAAINPDHIANTIGTAEKRQVGQVLAPFDAKAQYVSNKGVHKFVPPGPNDIRGPCPGLNAAANHGYLPHSGVANIQQFIDGTYKVFGMGVDLGGFLAVYGALFDGDLTSWSIGGPPPTSLLKPAAGLLGQPLGLTGSHNKYENDVSPTRGDLYLDGDNHSVQKDQFTALYELQGDLPDEQSNYDLGVFMRHRIARFEHNIAQNPYFVNGFFTGIEVQTAAFTFPFRFMGNKSAEFPEGRLTKSVLKAFFGVYGDGDDPSKFEIKQGWEYIPDNWYKRAIGDEYTIPFLQTDLVGQALQYPRFLDIGGNTGKVNTFTGIDLGNITGGVINGQNLLQGNNGPCLAFELLFQQGPDILEGLLENVGAAVGKFNKMLGPVISSLGCPQLQLDGEEFKREMSKFPGVTKLKKDGTYKLLKM